MIVQPDRVRRRSHGRRFITKEFLDSLHQTDRCQTDETREESDELSHSNEVPISKPPPSKTDHSTAPSETLEHPCQHCTSGDNPTHDTDRIKRETADQENIHHPGTRETTPLEQHTVYDNQSISGLQTEKLPTMDRKQTTLQQKHVGRTSPMTTGRRKAWKHSQPP